MSLNKPVNVNVQGNENTHVDVNVIIGNSYQYNDLRDQLKTQEDLFALLPENDIERRLKVSAKVNELKNQIEQFKQDVLKLAEAFQNIEVNTERLKRAKEHFDKGEIGEARAVLEMELEQMQTEQKHLLREREHYEKETLPKLQNNSEEFYLLALSMQADYANPNRFEDVCQHFQSSIDSYPTKANLSDYAKFLWEHKQFVEAEINCRLYLQKFKNEITDDEYAGILNNLAILHKAQNNYDEALKEYEEALQIRRQLAETNPNAYLPNVATTLNNLAILHQVQNNYDEALKEYEEALQICRQLAETNPNAYLPDVATTLNNLAVLHKSQNNYDEALKEYEEALQICRQLAETNPNAYLPDVAMTLNNLANLHADQNNYDEALKEYEEALQIRRQLAETNPNAYVPDVTMTLMNISLYYLKAVPEREKSVELAVEAVMFLTPIVEKVPYTQEYLETAIWVLAKWGLNAEEIEQLVEKKRRESEQK